MQVRSINTERLSTTLVHNNEKKLAFEERKNGTESFLEVTLARDGLLLQLNDSRVCKENLEHKLSEHDVISKALMLSVK